MSVIAKRHLVEAGLHVQVRQIVQALLVTLTLGIPGAAQQRQTCVAEAMLEELSVGRNSVLVGNGSDSTRLGAEDAEGGRPASGEKRSRSKEALERAYRQFERDARSGSAAAQVNLAVASMAGWGTRPNAGAALYWLAEAAQQRYPLAYFDLGVLYENGCGVRKDYAEAARYFRLGAKAEDAASQLNLGYLYDGGLGVQQDLSQAAAWYRKAAEKGLAQAQFNLGDLLAKGNGVQLDEPEAFLWFAKAAEQGHVPAELMLAAMYREGRGTARHLPLAYAWLKAAERQGDARAKAQLVELERQLTPGQLAEAKTQAERVGKAQKRQAELAMLRR